MKGKAVRIVQSAAMLAVTIAVGGALLGCGEHSASGISAGKVGALPSSSPERSGAGDHNGAPAAEDLPWYRYSGDVLPDSVSAIAGTDGKTRPFTNIANDSGHLSLDGKGNLLIDTHPDAAPAFAKLALPHPQAYPCFMTLVARVKGNSAGHRVADFEIAVSPDETTVGARVKAIIAPSSVKGLEVEKFDGENSISETLDTAGTHVYQLSMMLTSPEQGSFAVYVDGADSPVLSQHNVKLRATGKPGDNYVGMGANSSSTTYQSSIDWLVWTSAGAFTPGQLHGKLPPALGEVAGY